MVISFWFCDLLVYFSYDLSCEKLDQNVINIAEIETIKVISCSIDINEKK